MCTWMLIAALFILAKKWKQPQCSSADQCLNKMVFSHESDWNFDSCCNNDGHWKYYAKWNKTVTKGQILYDYIYMKYQEQVNP